MGIVSSFWASQEGGYPLGDIESEELENVSLFNLFLPKKPQNGQLTQYQNLIKFCYCAVTQLCATLWDPHGWQHARLPCPSPSPRACSNTCPFSWWCQPAFSSPVIPFSSCPQAFPASEFFSNESALCIRWPKHWSFSFSISSSVRFTLPYLPPRVVIMCAELPAHHVAQSGRSITMRLPIVILTVLGVDQLQLR